MTPAEFEHECAAVERDNVELHAALCEAIRRLRAAPTETISEDLLEVLRRTSRSP